jgi:hypothetical protein
MASILRKPVVTEGPIKGTLARSTQKVKKLISFKRNRRVPIPTNSANEGVWFGARHQVERRETAAVARERRISATRRESRP